MDHTKISEILNAVKPFVAGQTLPASLLISEGPNGLATYYAPFDFINTKAKVVICGITPGLHQANTALSAAAGALEEGADIETALRRAKDAGSFAGAMRNNLAAMLGHVGLSKLIDVDGCAELFGSRSELVHYTSALRYPVLKNGENYSGDQQMLNSSYLWDQIQQNLVAEIQALPDAIWIPLGQSVSSVFERLVESDVIADRQVLFGLPHASGANAERIKYFIGEKSREDLSNKVNPAVLDQRKRAVMEKLKLWKGEKNLSGLNNQTEPLEEPALESILKKRLKSVSYKVKRGERAGEIFVPAKNKSGKFIVSKTRFVRDEIYVDTLDEALRELQCGFKMRLGPNEKKGSLVNYKSLEIEFT
jgi:hypothetical protein